jgi:hypothetical protein
VFGKRSFVRALTTGGTEDEEGNAGSTTIIEKK